LKPQLDLVVYAQNNGLAGADNPLTPLPAGVYTGGYGTALGQILRRDNPAYGAALQLSLPLHNRTAQADAARDEIVVHQSEIRMEQFRNQARLEVQDAVIAVRRAQASYAAAAEAARLQLESLNAEKARYEEGVSTALNVAQFEDVYAQAQRSEVAARGSYAKASVTLQRATGALLEQYGLSTDLIHQAQKVR
jgi:outer membrane protein TolC